MDLATTIGFFLAWSIFIYGIILGAGSQWNVYVDIPSALMVVGGGMATALMSLPLPAFLKMGVVLKKAFFNKSQSAQKLIEQLVSYAEIARRDGILSLENATKDAGDPFIVKGIQMAVDGTDPELIEQIMNNELDAISDRHDLGKAVFDLLGKYAPAYGMLGTLVGLVIMLMNLNDPAKIGPGMAMALITTLYGSMIANMFALPLSDKLSQRNTEELMLKTIIIKGVMSIQSGDNPRIVEQKLKTFLPPKLRHDEEEEREAR